MEQRLIAVALLAGCVTAAGAGGYLAVRQMADASTPPATGEGLPGASAHSAVEVVDGTEAEITPVPSEEPAGGGRADTELPVRPTEDRITAPAAPRATPSQAPSARPAAPRPATTAAPRASTVPREAVPVQRPDVVPSAPPDSAIEAAGAATRDEVGTTTASDTWTAPDSGTATRDDRWPQRDADSTVAEAPLPGRTPEFDAGTPPAPVRRLESITIPADAVIGVQLESTVSTRTARVEDPVRARVTRDVLSGGSVVVPAGSRLLGSVTLVDEGGKVRERARLGVRFHTLVLADGTELRLPTETIYRDGESPSGRSAAKIGGATVGGAILGAILGGGKGAVIGAATGAGSGTAVAMAGDRRPAELRTGQPVTVRVSDAVTAQVER